jgi:hypothetical protein
MTNLFRIPSNVHGFETRVFGYFHLKLQVIAKRVQVGRAHWMETTAGSHFVTYSIKILASYNKIPKIEARPQSVVSDTTAMVGYCLTAHLHCEHL